VYKQTECLEQNSRKETRMEYEDEIRSYLKTIFNDVERTERIMCDLFKTSKCSEKETINRSLSQNEQDKRNTLYKMQHTVGNSPRQYRITNCNDKLHHKAHIDTSLCGGSKWDWFQIGGRWTGFFKLKKGIMEFSTGKPGLMTKEAKPGYADQCRKKDVDFEAMRDEAQARAEWEYDVVAKFFGGSIPELQYKWDDLIDEDGVYQHLDIDQKREMYHNQTPLKKLKQHNVLDTLPKKERDLLTWLEYENFLCTKAEYVARARSKAINTFAVVKDGKWYERGNMGWFAVTSNENPNWDTEFSKLLDELEPDTLLTVVDCHI
jgi:hypothetical protein